jgi:hypothetical protein
MSTLYVIAGPPRTGKTTIMRGVIQEKPIITISFDAVRDGLRKAIFDETFVSAKNLNFSGSVDFSRPGEATIHHKKFSKRIRESELTWQAIVGIIDHNDRELDGLDLLVEGPDITPNRVHDLRLRNLRVRAAFIGISSDNHSNTILAHANANKSDWINLWLKENGGDESIVRKWITGEIEISKKTKRLSAEFGYGYFDVSDKPFDEYVQSIKDYLLSTNK